MRDLMGWGRAAAVLLAATWWTAAVLAAETLAERLPAGAAASVEVAGLASAITRVEKSAALQAVAESAPYQAWRRSNDGKKAEAGRVVLETQLGMDLWTAGRRLLGDRLAVAIYPPAGRNRPEAVILVRVADEEIIPHLREKAKPWVALAGDQVRVEEQDDAWLVHLPDGGRAWLKGRWIVVASTSTLLEQTLPLLQDQPGAALAASPAWAHCRLEPRDGEALACVCVDLERIHSATGQNRLLPAKLDNPLASLLLGGLTELAAVSPATQATLSLTEQDFTLRARLAGDATRLDAAHQSFYSRAAAESEPVPAAPRQLAAFTLRRDWAEWYRRREELLEAKLLPGFDKFETGLSTLLPGKDFAEDVLAKLKGEISLFAAAQTYPQLANRPGLQLPALAVALDLREPESGSQVFQLFFQTLTAVLNLQAGQQGRQPWVIGSESYNGVQVSFAKYLETPKGELPWAFNFQPASALVDGHFVIASSLELCRDLVDAYQGLGKSGGAPDRNGAKRNFDLRLEPSAAADVLEANQAVLEARGIQEGKSAEQARQELRLLLELLRALRPVEIGTRLTESALEVQVQGGWK